LECFIGGIRIEELIEQSSRNLLDTVSRLSGDIAWLLWEWLPATIFCGKMPLPQKIVISPKIVLSEYVISTAGRNLYFLRVSTERFLASLGMT
jgi:hypothetical protein